MLGACSHVTVHVCFLFVASQVFFQLRDPDRGPPWNPKTTNRGIVKELKSLDTRVKTCCILISASEEIVGPSCKLEVW